MAKLKTLTIDSVANNVPVIEVGDYLKYDETLGKIEQVPTGQALAQQTYSVPSGNTLTQKTLHTFDKDGLAFVTVQATFPANASGYRYARLQVGSQVLGQRVAPSPSGTTINSVSLSYPVTAGQTIIIALSQYSGSTQNVDVITKIAFFPKTYE